MLFLAEVTTSARNNYKLNFERNFIISNDPCPLFTTDRRLISLAYIIRTLLARSESILVMSKNKIIINILVISKMVAEG